nr:hypothetical protein [Leptospira perolatii]
MRSVPEENFEEKNLHGRHYPASNELRIDLFRDSVRDLKGGYIGVGTDQNFTFIAWAKSDVAWLVDFDPIVCYINRIHLFFLKKSETPEEYRALWERNNFRSSFELLKSEFGKNKDWKWYESAWIEAFRGKSDVPTRWIELDRHKTKFGLITYIHNLEEYKYIRNLALNDRIQIRKADLNSIGTIREIAAAMSKIGVPFRVLYLSNAEEYFVYPDAFRENMISLPFDIGGVLLRTIQNRTKEVYGFPDGEKYPEKYPLHYNVQSVQTYKLWMESDRRFYVTQILDHRQSLQKGFSTMTLPPWEVFP